MKTKHIHFCQLYYTGMKLGLSLEELRLRVLREQNAMEDILGAKRENIKGIWRKLPNQELHNFCVSPNTILMMEWARQVAQVKEKIAHIHDFNE